MSKLTDWILHGAGRKRVPLAVYMEAKAIEGYIAKLEKKSDGAVCVWRGCAHEYHTPCREGYSSCGNPMQYGWRYCPFCGKKLEVLE